MARESMWNSRTQTIGELLGSLCRVRWFTPDAMACGGYDGRNAKGADMGAGRASQWGGAKRTISQLLELPEGDGVPTQDERNSVWDAYASASGKDALSPEQKASLLHSHASFRALFLRVPDDARVTELVAAAWLGIATRTLALGLKAAYEGAPPVPWRTRLGALLVDPLPEEAALLNAGFRWLFVRDVLPKKLKRQVDRAEERRDRLLEDHTRKVKASAYPGPVAERILFMVDKQGAVLHAFGQAHVDAEAFIELCAEGAQCIPLSPLDALSRPWRDLVAREAWEGPVRQALRVAHAVAEGDIGVGAAGTEQLLLEERLPPAAGKTILKPL
ncbi:hypothetical protein L2Y96_12845 [Luteibacter aegosomaticola]|uniref:hypothetical protein n=1 Tax=Luteibacter aegosomaticola TaxID=2911538 RepID=UPI001FFB719D|nr:hypothetical protein [Luteibacter aegosomaticola]UPG88308.1 hypothetical protein L2Y96_12845 [Luteibacter aegosomaticola]